MIELWTYKIFIGCIWPLGTLSLLTRILLMNFQILNKLYDPADPIVQKNQKAVLFNLNSMYIALLLLLGIDVFIHIVLPLIKKYAGWFQ